MEWGHWAGGLRSSELVPDTRLLDPFRIATLHTKEDFTHFLSLVFYGALFNPRNIYLPFQGQRDMLALLGSLETLCINHRILPWLSVVLLAKKPGGEHKIKQKLHFFHCVIWVWLSVPHVAMPDTLQDMTIGEVPRGDWVWGPTVQSLSGHMFPQSATKRGQTMMVTFLELTLTIEQQDCSGCTSGRNSLKGVGKEPPPRAPHLTSEQSSYPRAAWPSESWLWLDMSTMSSQGQEGD